MAAILGNFAENEIAMITQKQKREVMNLEKAIVQTSNYMECSGFATPVNLWGETRLKAFEALLKQRRSLLDRMFLCTDSEVADLRKTNDLLYTLTQKMHDKAVELYKAILRQGYDPDFDDDIMVEGTLRYVFNSPMSSVILSKEEASDIWKQNMNNPYGSNFSIMLGVLSEYYDNTDTPECMSCYVAYDISHKPEMNASELGIENILDDGQSWAEGVFNREEFKDICICYAAHDLCEHKLYSMQDLLRMNDFWCEIKISHQLLSDRDGSRFSFIGK